MLEFNVLITTRGSGAGVPSVSTTVASFASSRAARVAASIINNQKYLSPVKDEHGRPVFPELLVREATLLFDISPLA